MDQGIVCLACGVASRPGRRFCAQCAAPLALVCPSCGATNEPGDRFCGECATPLEAGAVAAPPTPVAALAAGGRAGAIGASPSSGGGDAPVAERRLVSVLFADLVAFTPFAEGRDPEDVRELLTRYFDLAREVVGRYGGTVEKFIGDAVMAVWGAPVAREDDAERAVRAALELMETVRSLGPAMQARAGVLTGEVAVTIGAVGQGMVAGDLVNTASRLQSAAPGGTVLVGESTMRAASAAIAFEPAGPLALKGKAEAVPAWRALRVVAEVGGRNRAEVLEAPFVGRDDELRLLKELYHATGRERRARLVSITGPAGVGKSRLAWELEKYLDGVVETVWWHRGRSPAYGEGLTFWALGEMMRARCGLLEQDDEATTRRKVAATVAEHVADPTERAWVESSLLALLGHASSSAGAPQELFAAWRTFLERLAVSGTVAMVFEDLHWADTGTLDFIDHLLEWSKSYPFFVVALARPELLDRRPDWGAGKRHFTSMFLEALPDSTMRRLLDGLVPGLPEAPTRAIVGRADGIPLYAVETVRMLVGEGRLVERDGVYAPAGDLSSLAVPETLTALIAARLDGLDPVDRALVQDGAVLGQSFSTGGLAAVSGIAAAEIEPRLRGLVRRELLRLEADPRSPEQGQYAFVQALIREVAYGMLSKRDRRQKHLAAARWLESLGSDELAAALAGHYLAAHENAAAGPEAEALAGQARIALRAAAERATALGAHDQAAGFLRQALAVTTDTADQAALLEQAGRSARLAGRHAESEDLLDQALARWRSLGDARAAARTSGALGATLLEGQRTESALALLSAAREEFAALADEPEGIAIGSQLARALMFHEELARSVEVADLVLASAERAYLVDLVADTLITRGSALCIMGQPFSGLGAIRAGEQLALERGLHATRLRALNNRCAYGIPVDPRDAVAAATEGLALALRLGHRGMAAGLLGNAAEGRFELGDWSLVHQLEALSGEEDLDAYDRVYVLSVAVAYRAASGRPVDDLLATIDAATPGDADAATRVPGKTARAAAMLATGDLRAARGLALDIADASALNATRALLDAGRAALWAGDADGARADLARLRSIAARGPAVDAWRTTVGAGIAALEGRIDEALAAYREALTACRDLGMRWQEAMCGIDMATLLDPAEPEVVAAVFAAREILRGLGARPYLERLEAAAARPGSRGPMAPSSAPSTLQGSVA